MDAARRVSIGAIILAGGRASRVDGAAKPLFTVGGRTLLQRAVDAAHTLKARPVTVVAPVLDEMLAVRWVREDPPFTGPAAAVVAALASLTEPDPEWTVLLAADLARPEQAVELLACAVDLLPADTDGVCVADASGRPQWLTGLYRTAGLREGAAALPDGGRDQPVRALFAERAIAVVPDADGASFDVDTWEDLEQARRDDPHAPPLP